MLFRSLELGTVVEVKDTVYLKGQEPEDTSNNDVKKALENLLTVLCAQKEKTKGTIAEAEAVISESKASLKEIEEKIKAVERLFGI